MLESEGDAAGNYYTLVAAGLRRPGSDTFNELRPIVDQMIFPNYFEHIQYAALSLNDTGAEVYGSCTISLKSALIQQRSSVFETNSLLYMVERGLPIPDALRIPAGLRAPWSARGRLAVAKLWSEIRPNATDGGFPSVLISRHPSSKQDDFIEVHIFGGLTTYTIESVQLSSVHNKRERLYVDAIQDICSSMGVPVSRQQ